MIKLILKLAVAALVANACWHIGVAYTAFYKFKDSVEETARFGAGKSEMELRERVHELAEMYDVPVPDEALSIKKNEAHVYVTASYTQPIEVVPGYRYPWPFSIDIDAYLASLPQPGR